MTMENPRLLIGNTSSNDWFSIVILIFRGGVNLQYSSTDCYSGVSLWWVYGVWVIDIWRSFLSFLTMVASKFSASWRQFGDSHGVLVGISYIGPFNKGLIAAKCLWKPGQIPKSMQPFWISSNGNSNSKDCQGNALYDPNLVDMYNLIYININVICIHYVSSWL